jgi:hypothetical protein
MNGTKPLEYHELVKLWDVGREICITCRSTSYRDCAYCNNERRFLPVGVGRNDRTRRNEPTPPQTTE